MDMSKSWVEKAWEIFFICIQGLLILECIYLGYVLWTSPRFPTQVSPGEIEAPRPSIEEWVKMNAFWKSHQEKLEKGLLSGRQHGRCQNPPR